MEICPYYKKKEHERCKLRITSSSGDAKKKRIEDVLARRDPSSHYIDVKFRKAVPARREKTQQRKIS